MESTMPKSPVEQFEKELAQFFNAPYAVAVDSCTHGIELCLRYLRSNNVTCPSHTYISIPFTFEKLGLEWSFDDYDWAGYYYIGNTNVIDAATYWQRNGYVTGSYMALSFQFKKHLNLGRGGAILLENLKDYTSLKKMAHDGRIPNKLWKTQDIDTIGYHYYMTIDTAMLGLEKLPEVSNKDATMWTQNDYPYLPDMTVFK
jgi:dTDP-4-amino-4,6-dideoxygalactose transaminase